MTDFGVAPPPAEMAEHVVSYGRLGHARFFYGPNKRYGWSKWPLTERPITPPMGMPGLVTPVISVKTWSEPDFEAMLAGVPADVGTWWFAYRHEPEDEIVSGEVMIENMRAVYARARALIAAHPGSRCQLVLILNWFQLVRQGFDVKRFDGVAECVDAVGVDSYSPATDAMRDLYVPPGALFGPAVDASERWGIPWSVPEYGLRLAADGNSVRHASVLRRHMDWMSAHGALWASYWCNLAGDYGPHPCRTATYARAFEVWKDRMQLW